MLQQEMGDPELRVLEDIWHYIDRLMAATFGKAHPLYGEMMARLSQCIFAPHEVDKELVSGLSRMCGW